MACAVDAAGTVRQASHEDVRALTDEQASQLRVASRPMRRGRGPVSEDPAPVPDVAPAADDRVAAVKSVLDDLISALSDVTRAKDIKAPLQAAKDAVAGLTS